MTLKELRERTKQACHEARQVPQGIGKPRFHGMNMRQAWEDSAKTVVPLLKAGLPEIEVLNSDLIVFYREGEIYYHAKKHGIQSAMLLKLSRS